MEAEVPVELDIFYELRQPTHLHQNHGVRKHQNNLVKND